MNSQDPLAKLHPLRVPADIGWWPLAPGWWILIGCAVLLLAVLAYRWHKHRQRNAYRRTALRQLETIMDTTEHSIWLGQINALLKSVAVHAFPRRDIAALSGARWLEFLNNSCGKSSKQIVFPAEFAEGVYTAAPPVVDKQKLVQTSRD